MGRKSNYSESPSQRQRQPDSARAGHQQQESARRDQTVRRTAGCGQRQGEGTFSAGAPVRTPIGDARRTD